MTEKTELGILRIALAGIAAWAITLLLWIYAPTYMNEIKLTFWGGLICISPALLFAKLKLGRRDR